MTANGCRCDSGLSRDPNYNRRSSPTTRSQRIRQTFLAAEELTLHFRGVVELLPVQTEPCLCRLHAWPGAIDPPPGAGIQSANSSNPDNQFPPKLALCDHQIMSTGLIIVRETLISVAVSIVFSVAFFIAVFGLAAPVPLGSMAIDFLPQSFMIALMSSLVPSFIPAKRSHAPLRAIVGRCLAIALASVVVFGGGAAALASTMREVALSSWSALSLSAAYAAGLAATATSIAVSQLLKIKGSAL